MNSKENGQPQRVQDAVYGMRELESGAGIGLCWRNWEVVCGKKCGGGTEKRCKDRTPHHSLIRTPLSTPCTIPLFPTTNPSTYHSAVLPSFHRFQPNQSGQGQAGQGQALPILLSCPLFLAPLFLHHSFVLTPLFRFCTIPLLPCHPSVLSCRSLTVCLPITDAYYSFLAIKVTNLILLGRPTEPVHFVVTITSFNPSS